MKSRLSGFWRDEGGQDLVEWALLIAMITMFSAAFLYSATTSMAGIWSRSNSEVQAANTYLGS